MSSQSFENTNISCGPVFGEQVKAISNWGGSSWNITHNKIIDLRARNGGGIGILVGDRFGGTVTDNVIAHNEVSGALTSMEGDSGGYNGSGIVLCADFRYGFSGTANMSYNRVVKNKISIIDASDIIDVVAFEITDTDLTPGKPVIHDNPVGFTDFRGTELQIQLHLKI